MTFIDEQLLEFKTEFEKVILERGQKGKTSAIRSSTLINLIHDAVKKQLIDCGVNPNNVFPKLYETKPEIKMAGFLKQKNQDVCVVPNNVPKKRIIIDWGPLSYEQKVDQYGFDYSQNTLVINVRSQMSSLAKNSDTLFERTFAEAQNLHMRYPNIVLGEVYLIPVYEYDDKYVKNKEIKFKTQKTNLEKYISFFHSISGRKNNGFDYSYERCALLIVDFNRKLPKLYQNSNELITAGLISDEFALEYANINFKDFSKDILKIYSNRFNLSNLK